MKTRFLRQYGLILIMLCALTGCVDEQEDYISKYCPGSCTEITGRISSGINRQAMQNVQLTATWKNLQPVFGGGTIRKKAVAKTDQQGNYTLRFLLRDDELQDGYIEIQYGIDNGKYLDCREGSAVHSGELKRDTTYTLDMYFPQRAYLSLELTNPQDMAPSDRFFSTIKYPSGSAPGRTCGYVFSWHGTSTTTQTAPVAAGDTVIIHKSGSKGGVQIVDSDTLTLSPGEQRVFKITF